MSKSYVRPLRTFKISNYFVSFLAVNDLNYYYIVYLTDSFLTQKWLNSEMLNRIFMLL